MPFYELILGALVVWRITHLLHAEDGPWDLLVRLRRRAGDGFWGGLLDCFYCLSLWVAAPLAVLLGETWRERLLLWPALSGAAILLHRITHRAAGIAPAAPVYYAEDRADLPEEEEDRDVLLRQGESTDPFHDRGRAPGSGPGPESSPESDRKPAAR
jgi:hypothetical protein